jgi:hypothetical protein
MKTFAGFLVACVLGFACLARGEPAGAGSKQESGGGEAGRWTRRDGL